VVDKQVGENPITGNQPAQFRVDLDPGDYRVTLLLGKAGAGNLTKVLDRGKEVGSIWTDQSAQSFTYYAEAQDGHLVIGLSNQPDMSWAVAGMEIAHAGFLADYRNFVFSSNPEDEALPQGALLVTEDMKYTPERKFGWV
jgi:hypothetical protein